MMRPLLFILLPLLLCVSITAQGVVVPDARTGIAYVPQADGTIQAWAAEGDQPVLLGTITGLGQVIRTRWTDEEGQTHEVETKVTGTNVDIYVARHDRLVRAMKSYYPPKRGG